mmetsp:Transcript_35230/g.51755  ORF Transcript_35230/g.51755 Transcript_35230/m.51755 type:complete len:246 (+) Transcript_35230:97-834(+)
MNIKLQVFSINTVTALIFWQLCSSSNAFHVAPSLTLRGRPGCADTEDTFLSPNHHIATPKPPSSYLTFSESRSFLSDTKLKLAGSVAAPPPDKEKSDKNKKKKRKRPDTVRLVETLIEYKEHVVDISDRLVVVRFYADWCRTCRAIEPSFYRLSSTYPNVAFVEVPVTKENTFLHKGLGVPSVPYAHIYHPEAGLVEEMKISRSSFKTFENALFSYVLGFCEIPEDGDELGSASENDDPFESIFA